MNVESLKESINLPNVFLITIKGASMTSFNPFSAFLPISFNPCSALSQSPENMPDTKSPKPVNTPFISSIIGSNAFFRPSTIPFAPSIAKSHFSDTMSNAVAILFTFQYG